MKSHCAKLSVASSYRLHRSFGVSPDSSRSGVYLTSIIQPTTTSALSASTTIVFVDDAQRQVREVVRMKLNLCCHNDLCWDGQLDGINLGLPAIYVSYRLIEVTSSVFLQLNPDTCEPSKVKRSIEQDFTHQCNIAVLCKPFQYFSCLLQAVGLYQAIVTQHLQVEAASFNSYVVKSHYNHIEWYCYYYNVGNAFPANKCLITIVIILSAYPEAHSSCHRLHQAYHFRVPYSIQA